VRGRGIAKVSVNSIFHGVNINETCGDRFIPQSLSTKLLISSYT